MGLYVVNYEWHTVNDGETERRSNAFEGMEGRKEREGEDELIEERNKRRRALDASHRVTMMEAV